MNEAQSDATPASGEPALNIPPPPEDGAPAGTADIPPPPPVDNAFVAEGGEQFAPDAAHPALPALERIEEIALLWGGDVMAELRQLVAEVRSLL